MKKIVGLGVLAGAVVGLAMVAIAQSSVSQQLIGRWEGRLKPFDVPMTMRFAPNGRLSVGFQYGADSTMRMAFLVNYSIDSKPKPMHLDLKLERAKSERDKQPVLTIFDLPNPRSLKVHVKNLAPGKPRPTQFDEPAELSKVSESAIVFPDAAKLAQAEQSQDGEGRLIMQQIALSSLYQTLETQQFPTQLNQLGLNNENTQNYRYQLQANPNQLTLIARPKKEKLRSYIAVVLKFSTEEQDFAATKVCQSVRPSQIAPPMPKTPNLPRTLLGTEAIQCGSGSEAIDF